MINDQAPIINDQLLLSFTYELAYFSPCLLSSFFLMTFAFSADSLPSPPYE